MRNHPVFQGPRTVNTSKPVRKPTPEAWQKDVKDKEVSVVSLVKNPEQKYRNGWISYCEPVIDSPEVEIICGGLSERAMDGAALWRQGHLLHFAFDISPAEMNQTGQALLLNCIAYIARFTEDRPIARTPSAWAEKGDAPKNRRWIEGFFATRPPSSNELNSYLTPATRALVAKMDRVSYPKWYRDNSPFLTCDPTGKLMIDSYAEELDLPFNKPDFFPKAIEKLKDAATAEKARELLKRYAPDGPATGASEEWAAWWQANGPYLFYTERGGYRWHIDPLAKRRAVPSEKLQGPARATGH